MSESRAADPGDAAYAAYAAAPDAASQADASATPQRSREVVFTKLSGQQCSLEVSSAESVGAVCARLAQVIGTTPLALDLISGLDLLDDMERPFPADAAEITLKLVDPHPWAHKTIRLLSVLNNENMWIGPTNVWSTLRATYPIGNVVADSIPLTCVPAPSVRHTYFLRTERFTSGVHAAGGQFWLGLRDEAAVNLLDVGKKTQVEASPVEFAAREAAGEEAGIFNMKVGDSWVGVCSHGGPYHDLGFGEHGFVTSRWLSPLHASQSDAMPIKVVAAIKSMGFQETYEDLEPQLSSCSSAPWVHADVLHPLAHKTIRLLSALNDENKWIGPTNEWSTMRAVYKIENFVADSIPLTCVPVASEQDTYFLRTERFLSGVHAEGGQFWLGLRQEGEVDLLDAGKKTQAEAVPVQFAARDPSEGGDGIVYMKIGEFWVGACAHPGPYREYGYNAQRWLSPIHVCKGDAMPIRLILAVATEAFEESLEDFRGSGQDQLDEHYFAERG